MLSLKKELKKLGYGFGYLILVICLAKIFALKWWGVWLLLMLGNTALMIYQKNLCVKIWLKRGVMLAVLLLLFRFLAGYGTWGYFAMIALILAFIFYGRRKHFIKVKHHIETMIWGKPLKEFIKKKQRPPKIKICSIRRDKNTNRNQAK